MTAENDDLLRRLRHRADVCNKEGILYTGSHKWTVFDLRDLLDMAAKRIESLQNEIYRLRNERDNLAAMLDRAAIAQEHP